jgi:uncharacterized protein (TIGR00369 family)
MTDIPEGYAPAWNEGFNAYVGPFYGKVREDGSVHFFLDQRDEHMNGAGHTHGGLLMAFADAVLGTAVNAAIDGAPSATMTLNADFIAAGSPGARLEGEAEVTRRTRSVVFVQGRVYAGDKTLLTATGIWKILGAS